MHLSFWGLGEGGGGGFCVWMSVVCLFYSLLGVEVCVHVCGFLNGKIVQPDIPRI